ncbi:hypothetical protein MiTe_04045 [Microcystis aeruginosa NIES-2520]|jgi:IS5 family transposase|uniref:Transposase InsH N-terminal domain-containing protein n=1 Tax=Microcystis aeruginosa NIES-2520 TaxID=2303982 RepID=A0A5A5RVR6_MICAE|nr:MULTISPECIES: transposase [Microcystis]NCR77549.1 transposase [Microcystis aeruginosa K13-06]MCA2669204.1 transposase [Microcystis sp. M045S2]MCA2714964.1 transposase [Microcystis sp. M172S2]MCA2802812.1 transposase [Microcystis sp. M114S2]MCA2835043.1 transposase [Microcystis sp. M007S1]
MVKRQGRVKKRQSRLEERQDKLQDLNRMIPWQRLSVRLEVLDLANRKSQAGRKPINRIVLLKMLVLKYLYNLSNEQLEYQTHDRASLRRFVGLEEGAEIPDGTTVDKWEKKLQKHGLIERLFEEFEEFLRESGYEAQGGQIIDATLVPVAIQRNSQEENEQIKKREIPPQWQDNPQLGAVLNPDNQGHEIWADSAYRSQNRSAGLEALGHISQIHERAYRHRPLSQEQIANNREKSKTRAKVEHVFGAWVISMGGKLMRGIALERVGAQIGLKNWVYNLKRYLFWQKQESCLAGGQCV